MIDFQKRENLLKVLTGLLFASGMMLSSGAVSTGENRLVNALVGLMVPALAAGVWGERTRPHHSFWWWLLGLGAVVGLAAVGQVVLGLSLLVGAFLVHDLRMTPTAMLVAGAGACLIFFDPEPASEVESKAWWVALSMLAITSAAVLERDRLAERNAPPTPLAWTAFRVAFLALWTLAIVSSRESLEVGRVFAAFGATVTGEEGQIFLMGTLLFMLALAALFLRSKRKAPNPPPGGPV